MRTEFTNKIAGLNRFHAEALALANEMVWL